MTASHPEPALSAGWYRAINSAAAKLALAAGVAPATVRSVSGFRRVEIKLTEQAVARQILTLTKSAMLVGVELPPRLTETGNDPQHFLSRRCSDDLSDDLLQICNYARTNELLATYHHHIQQFNKELDSIMADFEQYKIQWRDHWALYQHQHDQIRALTAPIVNRAATGPMSVRWNHLRNFSGQKFAHVIAALDHAIRQRDTASTNMIQLNKRIMTTMQRYQRHHAQRAFYRSKTVADYRNFRLLYVPKTTLYSMLKSDVEFEAEPDSHSKVLRLAHAWNQIYQEYIAADREMRDQHDEDRRTVIALRNQIIAARRGPRRRASLPLLAKRA